MKSLVHLSTRIFGCPLAIHQGKFETILGVLSDRLEIDLTEEQIKAASQSIGAQNNRQYQIQDGIAIIPIEGSLMKKTYGLDPMSGCSSYETIGAQYQDALKNPAVKGILLACDSPGGEVSGLFELCNLLAADRNKPVYAVADDCAYSAAYAIASCSDKIYVTLTGGVGSIGVVCAHVDQSKADAQKGLVYTFMYCGSHKTDNNSHIPLSDEAKAANQAEIDREYQMFVSLVAKNRGKAQKDIVGTQAGTFYGENAIPLLADKVGTFEDAFNDMQAVINNTDATMPAIKPTSTATSNAPWNGPSAKKNLKQNQHPAYYEKAYAFRNSSGDQTKKSTYSFIHHEVSEDGSIGAANLKACSSGIGILNGSRGADLSKYSSEDIKGIYAHLARHLKDAGEEVPPLKAESENEEMKKNLSIDEVIKLEAKKAQEAEDEASADECMDGDEDENDEDSDEDDEEDGKKKKKDPDEDDEDDAKKSKKASTSDLKHIMQLCKLQNVDLDRVSEFVTKGYSVNQVIKSLANDRAAASRSTKIVNTPKTNASTITLDSLEEEADRQAAGDPKKAFAIYRQLLRKNAGVYAKAEEAKSDALSTASTRRKYLAELTSKYGVN